jgi:RNA polymerase sigma-70 factor, ECF subfamily
MTPLHSLAQVPADAVHPSAPVQRTPKVIVLNRPEPTDLLRRVASGDASAVADCVATFGPLVMVLARRWSTDTADAEDAAQDVFFDLWKHAARYDATKASERGFVAMLARRRLIDRMRKRSREVPLESIPDGFDLPDEDSDASERAGDAMDARAALEQLTPLQRRFIERHLLDGKTHDEIARESQVPLGTVKSHIRRGLLKARALLTGRTVEEDA